ncbi:MAG: hypothetical protein sometimes fused to ribosomal protein S6 glutaminyl transferase [uncultured Aureispira sp.]|uniref:Retropepsin-like aspartic endopeptidase domain-containing protein n=1 Tax=uncultured Aureispira sp. TaxID=1331704 RepID=A0A6S6U3I9_9BACT|nr:MAG: hypothetical protein sometimes fused to ribosomal protein S6 glutaminyl transferase [uncultured Aureispira sp.]
MQPKTKVTIGRIEQADFIELDLMDIDVKIDTGAYTSSIHCHDIQEVSNQLHCHFLDKAHPAYNHKKLIFDHYNITIVKSSNGIAEPRYKIFTKIRFGAKKYAISLTLTDRGEMRYPVLIGRKFLNKKFLVDVSLTNNLKNNNEE